MAIVRFNDTVGETTVDEFFSDIEEEKSLSEADPAAAGLAYLLADAGIYDDDDGLGAAKKKQKKPKKKSLLTQRQPMPGPGALNPQSALPAKKKKKKKKGLFKKIAKKVSKVSKKLGIKDAAKFLAKNPIVKAGIKLTPGASAAVAAFNAAKGKKQAKAAVQSKDFEGAEMSIEDQVRQYAPQYGLDPEADIGELVAQFSKLKATGKIQSGGPLDQLLAALSGLKIAKQSVENEGDGGTGVPMWAIAAGGAALLFVLFRRR